MSVVVKGRLGASGLIHILERHSVEYYPTHSKGALFPANTSIEHISDGIKEVYTKGTRVSEVGKPVQTFEKRIKLNGESSNYRLIVDNNNKYVVSFFKITE